MLRHIEQRLLLIIEMAGHNQAARVRHAQALRNEIESARDRQRGGGQHDGVHLVEEAFGQEPETSMGVACRKKPRPRLPPNKRTPLRRSPSRNGGAWPSSSVRRINGITSSGGFFSSFEVRADQFQRGEQSRVDVLVLLAERGAALERGAASALAE